MGTLGRFGTVIWSVSFLFLWGCSGDDPAGGLPAAVYIQVVAGTDEHSVIEGYEKIRFTVDQINIVHSTDYSDSSTETIINISSQQQQFEIYPDPDPQIITQIEVPKGYVHQIRLVTSKVELFKNGLVYDVNVPSGNRSGLKLVPYNNMPFDIPSNGEVPLQANWVPATNMLLVSKDQYKMKPTIPTEQLPGEVANGPALNHSVYVRFTDEVTEEYVTTLNDAIGAVTDKKLHEFNDYVISIPKSLAAYDAIQYYQGKPGVLGAHGVFLSGITSPGIPAEYGNATFFANSAANLNSMNATQLWANIENRDGLENGNVGSREIIIAVIDGAFRLDHPDMIQNWYLNEGEIPAGLGIVDTDGDGVITFIDLNNDPNVGKCDVAINPNFDRYGNIANICDPYDLFADQAWNNDVDDDGNTYVDDLVGWHFGMDSNDVSPINSTAILKDYERHGTMVAGLAGATGNNQCAMGSCPNELKVSTALTPTGAISLAGDSLSPAWRVRILPLNVFNPYSGRAQYPDIKQALAYAAKAGATVANVSLGSTLYTRSSLPSACDSLNASRVGKRTYPKMRRNIVDSLAGISLDNMLVVASAGNCGVVPGGNFFMGVPEALKSLYSGNVLVVGGTTRLFATGETVLWPYSARGVSYLDITAPATYWYGAIPEAATTGLTGPGTSFAAPTISSIAGLVAASDLSLRNNVGGLRSTILGATSSTIVINDVYNGGFMDMSKITVP